MKELETRMRENRMTDDEIKKQNITMLAFSFSECVERKVSSFFPQNSVLASTCSIFPPRR